MADVILPLLFIIFILSFAGKRSSRKKKSIRSKPAAGISREMTKSGKDLTGKVHSKEHTHDRLDFDCYVNETGAEHYLKQLRSFLDAGIIERSEYQQIAARWGKL